VAGIERSASAGRVSEIEEKPGPTGPTRRAGRRAAQAGAPLTPLRAEPIQRDGGGPATAGWRKSPLPPEKQGMLALTARTPSLPHEGCARAAGCRSMERAPRVSASSGGRAHGLPLIELR
jgi:hypothetical protein